MRRWYYALPAVLFVAVAIFFFRSLNERSPDVLPSALIGKPVPGIVLPPLDAQTRGFGPRELSSGRVTVINVFASWCIPCHSEAPIVARLGHARDFELFGFVQKDTPQNIRAFLAKTGNPFERIGLDADGRASIEWGVYGVPETYVVDGRGIVRARIVGEITEDVLRTQLLPAIARARSGS